MEITPRDVMSASMYPKVFDEYVAFVERYSEAVEALPTRAFLAPLEVRGWPACRMASLKCAIRFGYLCTHTHTRLIPAKFQPP